MRNLAISSVGRDDDADLRRKRLLFRCWHRGTQEVDLIFGSFAEASLTSFSAAQLDRFEALLNCDDTDLSIGSPAAARRRRSTTTTWMRLSQSFGRRPILGPADEHLDRRC
jgi:succinate dehydrogenase flavin-adding protein (antitoxin of CptAB toxin-antitoxin module)